VALSINILDCVVRFCTWREFILTWLIAARVETGLNLIVEGISLIVWAAQHL
jgi:hypothetical protein